MESETTNARSIEREERKSLTEADLKTPPAPPTTEIVRVTITAKTSGEEIEYTAEVNAPVGLKDFTMVAAYISGKIQEGGGLLIPQKDGAFKFYFVRDFVDGITIKPLGVVGAKIG